MTELWVGLLGGGSLATIIVAWFQYRAKTKGGEIDWYDRAVDQVKTQDETIRRLKEYISDLEEKVRELEKQNDDLLDLVEELEELVMEMEKNKESLILQIDEYERREKKWKQ